MALSRDNKNLNFLFESILQLENIDECYDFFEDLCTVQELKTLSQRLSVAKNAFRKERLYGYCNADRCLHCNDQQG